MYDELLKDNPVNMLAMKRKVAVHKAQYHFKEACEVLHEIVHIYQNDLPSWLELAELHTSLFDYVVNYDTCAFYGY